MSRPVQQHFLQVEPMPPAKLRRFLLQQARDLVREVPKSQDISFVVILPEPVAREIGDCQAFFHGIFEQFARIKYADVDVVAQALTVGELQEHINRYRAGRDATFDYSAAAHNARLDGKDGAG